MRIAIVISGMGKGGGERVVSVLANRFTELGNEVTIIITGNNSDCAYDMDPKVRIVSLRHWIDEQNLVERPLNRIIKKLRKVFVKQDEFEKCYRDYKNCSNMLVAYLRKNPVDYALSFLVYDNMSLALCSKRQNAKVIICEGTYPDRPDYTDTFKLVRNKCYEKADFRVYQTNEQKKLFPKQLWKKSTVIGNPLNEDLPFPFNGKRRNIIVNFCRLDKPKNLLLLLDAFSLLEKEYPDYELNIYGDGPLRDELQEYIELLKIGKKAFLLQFESDLHNKIKDCAMFVTSSDFEGLSNSLLEAMAIGMPVIATDCLGGGAKSVINNESNGLLVPRGDAEKLCCAMKSYIENLSLSESCGQNAQKIREEFSVNSITDKWLDLFKRL